jgi:hypothetical protein
MYMRISSLEAGAAELRKQTGTVCGVHEDW